MTIRFKLFASFVVLCLICPSLYARTKVQFDVTDGPVQVVTSFAGLRTPVLKSCPGATVQMRIGGVAQILYDVSGNSIGTSTTAGTNGRVSFYIADGTYDVHMTGGGVVNGVGIPCSTHTWTGWIVGGGQLAVSITGMGALCDGSTNDAVAIQSAFDIAGAHNILWPAGFCRTTDTIFVKQSYIRVDGAGSYNSHLVFDPLVAGKAAIKIATAGTGISGISHVKIKGLRIYSNNTTLQKIGIDVIDGSFIDFEDVVIGSESMFLGTSGGTTIGIRLKGRELINMRRVSIWANDGIALDIQDNPNNVIDIDYLVIEGGSVFSGDKTTNSILPVIRIGTSIQLSRSSIRDLNMSFGGHAIYWVDSLSAMSSDQFTIENVAWEQGKSANGTGNFLRIDRTGSGAMNNLTVKNCITGGDGTSNGIYLRNVVNPIIEAFEYVNATGETPLDIDSVGNLSMRANAFAGGSVVVAPNMTRVLGAGRSGTSNVPSRSFEIWESTGNPQKDLSLEIWGVPHWASTGTIAPAASVAIPMLSGTLTVGTVNVSARGSTIIEGGSVILHTGGAILLNGTANFAASSVASKLCVVWTSGTAANLVNNTAETLSYVMTFAFRQF